MIKPYAKLFIAIYLIVEMIQCMRIECEGHEYKDTVTDLWIQVCSLPCFVTVQGIFGKCKIYFFSLAFLRTTGEKLKGSGSHGFWLSLLSFFDMPNRRVTHFFSVSLALISLSA
jgi:hypothetical protein